MSDSADNMGAVAGSAEFERLFFSMRHSLRRLNLGDYIYDDLIVYIGEMCRNIEVLELNSRTLSDAAVAHMLNRAEHLKVIDVSGLVDFTGLALTDVHENNFGAKGLEWLVLNMQGHELIVVKERLAELAPNCKVRLEPLKAKKYFPVE